MWVILLAMGVFSSFISSITSTVSSLRTARQEQFQQQSKLLRFFNERNLSIDLYGQVQEFIRKQGVFEVRLKETDVSLIQNIPERLLGLKEHHSDTSGSTLRFTWKLNDGREQTPAYYG